MREIYANDLTEASSQSAYQQANSKSWKPRVLKNWGLLLLLIYLIAILVTLALLFTSFGDSSIYYTSQIQMTDPFADRFSILSMSPYSIISTLFAVIIRIWWSSLDQAFRRVQPYFSMAEKPTRPSKGAGISYMGCTSLWVVAKAIWNHHALVAVVAVGAVLSEICKLPILSASLITC